MRPNIRESISQQDYEDPKAIEKKELDQDIHLSV